MSTKMSGNQPFVRLLYSHNADSHLHTCTYICRIIHNDKMMKTDADFFNKYLPLTLLRGLEKVIQSLPGEWDLVTEQKLQYFDPHSYGRHVMSFLFSWCSTGGPEAHSAGGWLPLLHLNQQLLWFPNSIGVPEGPLGRVWLSLPHLVQLQLELELALDFCLDWAI